MTKTNKVICIMAVMLVLFATSAYSAANRGTFEFLAFPNTVFVNNTGELNVCMANKGLTVDLINNGGTDLDQIVTSIPMGAAAKDLVNDAAFACSSENLSWQCSLSVSGTDVLLTMWPNGNVTVNEGDLICFRLDPVLVNPVAGLTFLNVDQQISNQRATRPVNTQISVYKAGQSTLTETDPKVGNLTTNRIPKWNGSKLIDSTSIVENDTTGNVGIGRGDNAAAKLDVGGDIAVNGSLIINGSGQWVGDPTGLIGPQGPAGPQGPQGIQGIQGEPGPQGIQGLKGDKGDQGIQGIQGIPGVPGTNGIDGKDGQPGAPGAPGAPGKDGIDGKDGKDAVLPFKIIYGTAAQWVSIAKDAGMILTPVNFGYTFSQTPIVLISNASPDGSSVGPGLPRVISTTRSGFTAKTHNTAHVTINGTFEYNWIAIGQ